ncbi:MAG TPA: hypothetical protein VEX13_07095, partial [Chloroflexia bacterium]|nr:hypothetical protein [Chloroflexia bacterium]
ISSSTPVWLFSPEALYGSKGVIWVLRDEISHCVRNDIKGAWVLISGGLVLEMTSRFANHRGLASTALAS